jgi:hypothetical protein
MVLYLPSHEVWSLEKSTLGLQSELPTRYLSGIDDHSGASCGSTDTTERRLTLEPGKLLQLVDLCVKGRNLRSATFSVTSQPAWPLHGRMGLFVILAGSLTF